MSLETLSSRAPSLPMPTTHSWRAGRRAARRAVHGVELGQAWAQAASSANSASSVMAG
jgi:hypothetical protein